MGATTIEPTCSNCGVDGYCDDPDHWHANLDARCNYSGVYAREGYAGERCPGCGATVELVTSWPEIYPRFSWHLTPKGGNR